MKRREKKKNSVHFRVRNLWRRRGDAYCFAICRLIDRSASARSTRLAPTSLKTIINRFLHARCSLRVRIFPCISNKTKQTHKSVSALFGGEGEIRTPAPLSRPTPLAGAPLRPAWVLLQVENKSRYSVFVNRIPAHFVYYKINCNLSQEFFEKLFI